MRRKILVIEDDKEINDFVSSFLTEKGYDVLSEYNGLHGISVVQRELPDLILLDIMLPYQSGDEILKSVRASYNIPVIIISAKITTQAKVDLLRLGADDYVTKPFDLNELLARIEAVLKRSVLLSKTVTGQSLEHGAIKIYLDTKEVYIEGQSIAVTSKEFAILELLMTTPGKIFSKQNLYESIWNDAYAYDNDTINTHMSNLRKKMKNSTDTEYIETIWGIGYRLKQL